MRVAQAYLAKSHKNEAIEILAAWASVANDPEGHKMLAEALRHGPDNPLAKAAFARMEGLGDSSALDAARQKWPHEKLSTVEKELKKPPVGGWQAEVGYNNNVKYRDQVFHIQTEDSGVKRPHIITHLFADGGRILKSYKRSYAELLERDDLSGQVRLWMKNQHKEMYIALREGKYDNVIDGKESGGMEVLEGPPNPERRKGPAHEADADAKAEAKPAVKSSPSTASLPAQTPAKVPTPAPVRPASVAAAQPPAATPAAAKAPATPAKIVPTTPSTAATPAVARPVAPRPASVAATQPPAVMLPVRARLHVIRACGDGPLLHELREETSVIGRSGGVVVVGDKFVAPNHATLTFRGSKLELEPIGDWPVFIRLKYPVELDFDDIFVAGDQVLRVEANPPPNDGPDHHPTYLYTSPKWPTAFRVVQLWEGGSPGQCCVAKTSSVQIGRANSDLSFSHDFWLSDAHCAVEDQGGFLMLTDLGSRGGTFVRVKGPTAVNTGDEILVGRTRLRIEMLSKNGAS